MTRIILILLFFISINTLLSQNNSFDYNIGNFENAVSFDINSYGEIYVIDESNNSLQKLDMNGNVTLSIGGFGWETSTFDEPMNVSTNNLRIYVADKNNHRIQLFDRDLNFIGVIKSEDEEGLAFTYPSRVNISAQGDIFILDSESEKIFKLDPFGNLLTVIGDYDAGDYILQSPLDMALTNSESLLVLSEGIIYIFDTFGTGINRIALDFRPTTIFISGESVFLASETQVKMFKLSDKGVQTQPIFSAENEIQIQDIYVDRNKLYLLTLKTILLVNLSPTY